MTIGKSKNGNNNINSSKPGNGPKIGASTGNGPKIGASTDNGPKIGASTDNGPEIGASTGNGPKIGASTDNGPKIGASTDNGPEIGASAANIPEIGASAANIPKIGASTTNIPKIGASTTNIPTIGASTTNIPTIGENKNGNKPYVNESKLAREEKISGVPVSASGSALGKGSAPAPAPGNGNGNGPELGSGNRNGSEPGSVGWWSALGNGSAGSVPAPAPEPAPGKGSALGSVGWWSALGNGSAGSALGNGSVPEPEPEPEPEPAPAPGPGKGKGKGNGSPAPGPGSLKTYSCNDTEDNKKYMCVTWIEEPFVPSKDPINAPKYNYDIDTMMKAVDAVILDSIGKKPFIPANTNGHFTGIKVSIEDIYAEIEKRPGKYGYPEKGQHSSHQKLPHFCDWRMTEVYRTITNEMKTNPNKKEVFITEEDITNYNSQIRAEERIRAYQRDFERVNSITAKGLRKFELNRLAQKYNLDSTGSDDKNNQDSTNDRKSYNRDSKGRNPNNRDSTGSDDENNQDSTNDRKSYNRDSKGRNPNNRGSNDSDDENNQDSTNDRKSYNRDSNYRNPYNRGSNDSDDENNQDSTNDRKSYNRDSNYRNPYNRGSNDSDDENNQDSTNDRKSYNRDSNYRNPNNRGSNDGNYENNQDSTNDRKSYNRDSNYRNPNNRGSNDGNYENNQDPYGNDSEPKRKSDTYYNDYKTGRYNSEQKSYSDPYYYPADTYDWEQKNNTTDNTTTFKDHKSPNAENKYTPKDTIWYDKEYDDSDESIPDVKNTFGIENTINKLDKLAKQIKLGYQFDLHRPIYDHGLVKIKQRKIPFVNLRNTVRSTIHLLKKIKLQTHVEVELIDKHMMPPEFSINQVYTLPLKNQIYEHSKIRFLHKNIPNVSLSNQVASIIDLISSIHLVNVLDVSTKSHDDTINTVKLNDIYTLDLNSLTNKHGDLRINQQVAKMVWLIPSVRETMRFINGMHIKHIVDVKLDLDDHKQFKITNESTIGLNSLTNKHSDLRINQQVAKMVWLIPSVRETMRFINGMHIKHIVDVKLDLDDHKQFKITNENTIDLNSNIYKFPKPILDLNNNYVVLIPSVRELLRVVFDIKLVSRYDIDTRGHEPYINLKLNNLNTFKVSPITAFTPVGLQQEHVVHIDTDNISPTIKNFQNESTLKVNTYSNGIVLRDSSEDIPRVKIFADAFNVMNIISRIKIVKLNPIRAETQVLTHDQNTKIDLIQETPLNLAIETGRVPLPKLDNTVLTIEDKPATVDLFWASKFPDVPLNHLSSLDLKKSFPVEAYLLKQPVLLIGPNVRRTLKLISQIKLIYRQSINVQELIEDSVCHLNNLVPIKVRDLPKNPGLNIAKASLKHEFQDLMDIILNIKLEHQPVIDLYKLTKFAKTTLKNLQGFNVQDEIDKHHASIQKDHTINLKNVQNEINDMRVNLIPTQHINLTPIIYRQGGLKLRDFIVNLRDEVRNTLNTIFKMSLKIQRLYFSVNGEGVVVNEPNVSDESTFYRGYEIIPISDNMLTYNETNDSTFVNDLHSIVQYVREFTQKNNEIAAFKFSCDVDDSTTINGHKINKLCYTTNKLYAIKTRQ